MLTRWLRLRLMAIRSAVLAVQRGDSGFPSSWIDGGWSLDAATGALRREPFDKPRKFRPGGQLHARRPSHLRARGHGGVRRGSPGSGFCTYSNTDTVDGTPPPAPREGAGRSVFVYCALLIGSARRLVVGDQRGRPAGGVASPAELAQQAYCAADTGSGSTGLQPAARHRGCGRDGGGFCDVAVAGRSSASARSVTAAAGPNSATVTARPASVFLIRGMGRRRWCVRAAAGRTTRRNRVRPRIVCTDICGRQ